MPTKEELIKFISENEFNEEIIGQLFGILTKEKEEPKDAEEQPDLPEDKKPSLEEIEKVWTSFKSVPQELKLPSAPDNPIVVRHEENRPQPRRDRETEKGMACVIGRLRECSVFDVKFVALSHNTKRGAAMGGILNAELLKAKGFFDNL